MAVEAIAWALKTPIRRSSTKFVLMVLGNCADGDSWEAFPSIGYLCDSTALDRKTVVAALRSLSADGYITDTGERRGQTRQIPIYRLNSSENGSAKQTQKRNDSENGTVPKTDGNSPVFTAEESRFSLETVPKTEHGTVSNRKGTEREPGRKPRKKVQPSAGTTLTEFFKRCEDAGEDPLPATAGVFDYAVKIRLPDRFLELCWHEFVKKYERRPDHRQDNWRLLFRHHVEKNWLALWRIDNGTGEYVLTTAGLQAEREHFGANSSQAADTIEGKTRSLEELGL